MSKTDKYKQHIEQEYIRLFKDEISEDKRPYYHLIMYGYEGLEGYKVVRSESELPLNTLHKMELRARYNSQRNIHLYGFKAKQQVPKEHISAHFLKTQAIKIF